jgi:DNA-damage-inducible protein J
MNNSATIQVRVDEPTKTQAKNVFNMLGMSLSEGICLFLRQVVMHQGLPFEVKIPNALTAKTLEESEKGIDLHTASSVDELFKELEA